MLGGRRISIALPIGGVSFCRNKFVNIILFSIWFVILEYMPMFLIFQFLIFIFFICMWKERKLSRDTGGHLWRHGVDIAADSRDFILIELVRGDTFNRWILIHIRIKWNLYFTCGYLIMYWNYCNVTTIDHILGGIKL